MKLRYHLLFAGGLLLCLTCRVIAQGVTVSPTRLFFTGAPGSVQQQTITIINGTKEPMAFNVSFCDWYRDSVGNKVYLPAGTENRSNAAWLQPSENTVTIAEGTTGRFILEKHKR